MEVKVYSAESSILSFKVIVKEMVSDLKGSWGLGVRLAKRDLSAQYRQSYFGFFWAFARIFAITGTMIFLKSKNVVNTGDDPNVPYVPFVLISTILWQVFADAMGAQVSLLNKNKNLILKVNFPKECFFISSFLKNMFSLGIKLPFALFAFAYFALDISWSTLLLVIPFTLILYALGFSIGTMISPLAFLYTDFKRAINLFMTFWMFVTPIVYPLTVEKVNEIYIVLNPVAPVIQTIRDCIFTGNIMLLERTLVVTLMSVFMVFASWFFYRISIPIITERAS